MSDTLPPTIPDAIDDDVERALWHDHFTKLYAHWGVEPTFTVQRPVEPVPTEDVQLTGSEAITAFLLTKVQFVAEVQP